jgi:hypothetical protein
MKKTYNLEIGEVSRHVEVTESVIRFMPSPLGDDADSSGYEAQGHIRNLGKKKLENVVVDVSYYSAGGEFLGLDKTGFLDSDEVESGDRIPFSVDLDLPEGTSRCVLNVAAKKAGWITGLF